MHGRNVTDNMKLYFSLSPHSEICYNGYPHPAKFAATLASKNGKLNRKVADIEIFMRITSTQITPHVDIIWAITTVVDISEDDKPNADHDTDSA